MTRTAREGLLLHSRIWSLGLRRACLWAGRRGGCHRTEMERVSGWGSQGWDCSSGYASLCSSPCSESPGGCWDLGQGFDSTLAMRVSPFVWAEQEAARRTRWLCSPQHRPRYRLEAADSAPMSDRADQNRSLGLCRWPDELWGLWQGLGQEPSPTSLPQI